MAFILKDIEKVPVSVTPVTAAGNPAKVDGNPVWYSSDESVLTVEADATGLKAYVISTGKLGTAQVNVKADADIGDGVKEIVGTLDVEVQASEAVSLGVNAGAAEPK